MKTILLTLAYFLCCEGAAVVPKDMPRVVNNRPIIGILSQEQSLHLHSKYPEKNYTSFIAASYVKDIESSGARVAPIMIGKDRGYYARIMRKINGVLFPGGGAKFQNANGYADAGQHIYEIAKELNDQGEYFPLFGTCLGFELLMVLASGRGKEENRARCHSYGNQPLNFVRDFRSSKMFRYAPEKVVQSLANEDITVHAHSHCILDKNLKSYNLTKDWRVTSRGKDDNYVEFIASVEHKRFPFYGVQFHPEKSAFEWKRSEYYAHSAEAVKTNRYFMDFFVNECRKSSHVFANVAEENRHLIYSYKPHFTGPLGSLYQECYLFESTEQGADSKYL